MDYRISKTTTKRGIVTSRLSPVKVDSSTREQLHDWYLANGWQYAFVEDQHGHSHCYVSTNVPGQIARTTYTYTIPA